MSHLKDFIQQTRWMFPWWHIKVISLTPDLRLITSLTPAIEASLFFSNCQWSCTVRQHHGSSLHPLLHLPVCPSIPPRWLRRESSSDPWQLSPRGAWIICQSDSKRLSGTSSALPLQLNRVPSPSDTSCLLPALKKKKVLKLPDRQTVMMALTTCIKHLWVSTCRSQSWVSSQHIWYFLCGVLPTHLSFLSSARSLL